MEAETQDSSPSEAKPTGSASVGEPQGLFSSFSEHQFRWLFASNSTFFLALAGQQVLRSWLAFQITGNARSLGLISAMVAIPMLLIAPIGGVVADRVDRRTLVAAGQAVTVVAESVILWLLISGSLEYWHLLVSAAVLGATFPFIMPARQAIIANSVGRQRLTNAMALNMAAVNTTRVVGPAVAGFLIGTTGAGFAYGLNVALFFIALTCMLGVGPAPPAKGTVEASPRRNLRAGFDYIRSDSLVFVLLFFGLVPMFLVMPFQNLLVVFAEDVWQVGALGFGFLNAASGTGGLVGAILVAWHSKAPGRLRTMMVSVFAFGLFLVLFAISPWYLLALPMVFIASAFANLYSTLNNTAIQVLIPNEVRGRVSSFLMMSFSLPLLGTLPVSALADTVGAPIAISVASALAVVIAIAFYAWSPPLRSMDERIREALS